MRKKKHYKMGKLCIILKFAKKNLYPLDFIRCINAARKIEAQTPQHKKILGNETSIITITEAPSAASNVYFVVNAGRITSAR